jgi:uncharacterized protein YjiS (DUF1127 family)
MSHRTVLAPRADAFLIRTLACLNHMGDRYIRAVRKWRQVRRGRMALSTFDDRLLADIGITRHQIGITEPSDEFP